MAFTIEVSNENETKIQAYLTSFGFQSTPQQYVEGMVQAIVLRDLDGDKKQAKIVEIRNLLTGEHNFSEKTIEQLNSLKTYLEENL